MEAEASWFATNRLARRPAMQLWHWDPYAFMHVATACREAATARICPSPLAPRQVAHHNALSPQRLTMTFWSPALHNQHRQRRWGCHLQR